MALLYWEAQYAAHGKFSYIESIMRTVLSKFIKSRTSTQVKRGSVSGTHSGNHLL